MPLSPAEKKRPGPLATPEEVRLHLIAAARAGRSITYSELLERLGYSFSRPKMRQLCAVLSAVDQEAEGLGEPELAVLVVRQSDGIPGQGWWVERARHGAGMIANSRGQSAPAGGGARGRDYAGPWEGPMAFRFVASVQAEAFAFWQCHSGTNGPARCG